MLSALLIGSSALIINMAIQVVAIVFVIDLILHRLNTGRMIPSFRTDVKVMGVILLVLSAGHALQVATWAMIFMWLGEFSGFELAFYHSVVNFTTLGYGDVIMSETWRLLGGLEAANGVLMFGLTTSSLLTVMNKLFSRHKIITETQQKGTSSNM